MDPYGILEVGPDASDAELRAAYRRAVQREHPDHNGGSPEAARRFEAVQEAWAEIRRLRDSEPRSAERPAPADPSVESRLAARERELRAAREAGERAAREAAAARAAARSAAAEAAADAGGERPSDEELGYVRTDDTFGKILSDAREELLGTIQEKPVTERAADLLDEVAAALRGGRPRRSS
jgi:curved DNA-binding protein CbpA